MISWIGGSGLFAGLTGFLALVAGGAAPAISIANTALGTLEAANDDIVRRLQQRQTRQRHAMSLAQGRMANLNEQIAISRNRVITADNQVAELTQQIKDMSSRARLNRFIRSRVAGGEYQKHLGIVATIRKDFETLSAIMMDRPWEEQNKARLRKTGIDLSDLKSFERIVLYIDDLDRCPADRVVEVLQAVHLLLAFKLFVVVVGVDVRWVSRSLSLRYPHLLDETVARDIESTAFSAAGPTANGPSGAAAGERLRISELIASSHDYLEKIFQVPYWVKPMDEESSRKFLEGLVDATSGGATARLQMEVVEHSEEASQEPSDEAVTPSEPEPSNQTELEPEEEVKPEEEVEPEEEAEPEEDAEMPTEASAPSLADFPLTAEEIEFMKTLAPFVGRSPRRSKRFFNVYQLVRASLRPEEREGFLGNNGEALDYRVVMALLAIVTGAPILAPHFFEKVIEQAAGKSHSINRLATRVSKDRAFTSSSEWDRLNGTLKVLRGLGKDVDTFEMLRHWTRRAMRYSFTARPV